MSKTADLINGINSAINGFVWGPAMLAMLVGTGLFLSVCTGFLQIRKFTFFHKKTIGSLFSKKQRCKEASGVSPFGAVATALAGTIGTGSIAGIATAIVLGGPGSVFWMWISALLGMVTKYAEIILSIRFREKNENGQWVGGPMYYIRNGLNLKKLAALFAVLAMASCMGTGNAVQSNSIALALSSTIKVSPWITGAVLTVIVTIVILGGINRISFINEKLVPIMAVFYVACSLAAVLFNINRIPGVFAMIFREAFNFNAAAGGAAGYGIMTAMRYGFSRGIFSNEAGLGTAPIAHAASNTKSPVEQGLWGMFEVFFTTVILCTLSALVILTADLWHGGNLDGAALSIASFDSLLPGIGNIVVTLSAIFFALSTILGWAYYGEVAIGYFVRNSPKAIDVYRIIYIAVTFAGATGSARLIWGISETMNGLMAIPNLIALIGLFKTVRNLTNEYFEKSSGIFRGTYQQTEKNTLRHNSTV